MKELNDRQRMFAELVVSGMPAGRAYEQAGYKSRGAAADVNASKLIRNPKVSKFMAELREKAMESAQMSLNEALAFLADAIRTPVGEVDENHPLCQEWVRQEVGDGGENVSTWTIRTKMVGKLEAVKQLALMMGWNKPEEHKHQVDGLTTLMEKLRAMG